MPVLIVMIWQKNVCNHFWQIAPLLQIRAVLIMIMIKTLPKMAFAAAFFFTKLPFQTYFNVTFFITFVFNLGQRKNE